MCGSGNPTTSAKSTKTRTIAAPDVAQQEFEQANVLAVLPNRIGPGQHRNRYGIGH